MNKYYFINRFDTKLINLQDKKTVIIYRNYDLKKVDKNEILKIKSECRKNGNKFLSRQQTPTVYQPAGSVYALRKKFLFSINSLLPQGKTLGLKVSKEESINIDSQIDFLVAKTLFNLKRK